LGSTVLIRAAEEGHLEVVKFLVKEAGADKDTTSEVSAFLL
jgi:hypothetical protein